MAKRLSDVARVQQYFETADVSAAQVMLEIAGGIVKRRNGDQPATPRKQRSDKGTKRQGELLPAAEDGAKA